MGKKAAGCIALACCLLLFGSTVHADSVDDLYAVYNIDKTAEVDESVTDVIKSYDRAKKFVAMYNYVDMSEYDTSIQDRELSKLNKQVTEIDNNLKAGYDLPYSEIVSLEGERSEALERIDWINNTKDCKPVVIEVPELNDLPTYEEYIAAKKEESEFELSKNIGDVKDIQFPIQDECSIKSHDIHETVFTGFSVSNALALWKGTVSFSDNGVIIIEVVGGVKVTYRGIAGTDLSEGDVVKQYQPIGTVVQECRMSLQIDDDYVDIWRLYK